MRCDTDSGTVQDWSVLPSHAHFELYSLVSYICTLQYNILYKFTILYDYSGVAIARDAIALDYSKLLCCAVLCCCRASSIFCGTASSKTQPPISRDFCTAHAASTGSRSGAYSRRAPTYSTSTPTNCAVADCSSAVQCSEECREECRT